MNAIARPVGLPGLHRTRPVSQPAAVARHEHTPDAWIDAPAAVLAHAVDNDATEPLLDNPHWLIPAAVFVVGAMGGSVAAGLIAAGVCVAFFAFLAAIELERRHGMARVAAIHKETKP